MLVYKCKMCGGTIEVEEGATVGICESCGVKQVLPRLDTDERNDGFPKKNEEKEAKEEADRLKAEHKAEERRIVTEKAAKSRKKTIAITAPIVCVCVAFFFVLIKVVIPNSKYNAAVTLKNSGKYSEAITAFEEMGGYKDSNEQISACQTALKDIDYNAAVTLMNDGKYTEAITAFEALNGYKDSATKAKKAIEQYEIEQYEYEQLKASEVGDIVYFGAYEQDNDTSNGKEDIEWIVLAKENGKALVISKYALDCQMYNSTYTGVTWETCSLRTWLNGSFLNNAFSADEQAKIATTNVSADKNPQYDYNSHPGNATNDKVFLLSITEANKYFTSDSARACKGTEYCYAQGAYKYSNGLCFWWLRSPGDNQIYAPFVSIVGSVYYCGDYVFNDILADHQRTRINVILGLEEDIHGAGYNVHQSMIAIGSGGFAGKGFMKGTQTKLKYVPEQDTDFIFCTVGEEKGFLGSVSVLLLYMALLLRLISLSERQTSVFGRVYGYSVVSILLFHLFINIGMVGITPVIGIPLPFFSYGGSSLWGFTLLISVFLRIDCERGNSY